MRKILSLLLLCFIVASCGKSGNDAPPSQVTDSNSGSLMKVVPMSDRGFGVYAETENYQYFLADVQLDWTRDSYRPEVTETTLRIMDKNKGTFKDVRLVGEGVEKIVSVGNKAYVFAHVGRYGLFSVYVFENDSFSTWIKTSMEVGTATAVVGNNILCFSGGDIHEIDTKKDIVRWVGRFSLPEYVIFDYPDINSWDKGYQVIFSPDHNSLVLWRLAYDGTRYFWLINIPDMSMQYYQVSSDSGVDVLGAYWGSRKDVYIIERVDTAVRVVSSDQNYGSNVRIIGQSPIENLRFHNGILYFQSAEYENFGTLLGYNIATGKETEFFKVKNQLLLSDAQEYLDFEDGGSTLFLKKTSTNEVVTSYNFKKQISYIILNKEGNVVRVYLGDDDYVFLSLP